MSRGLQGKAFWQRDRLPEMTAWGETLTAIGDARVVGQAEPRNLSRLGCQAGEWD